MRCVRESFLEEVFICSRHAVLWKQFCNYVAMLILGSDHEKEYKGPRLWVDSNRSAKSSRFHSLLLFRFRHQILLRIIRNCGVGNSSISVCPHNPYLQRFFTVHKRYESKCPAAETRIKLTRTRTAFNIHQVAGARSTYSSFTFPLALMRNLVM